MSNTDFLDSHRRHLADAETLFGMSRFANADHLYGLSAECGLKRLMEAFGMQLDQTGSPPKKDRQHIDQLDVRYQAYLTGSPHATNYAYRAATGVAGWSISQRYAPQMGFSKASVAPRRTAAGDIGAMVQRAVVEGLIR